MANESASEKKLLKLIKQEVFSSEITDALTEVLETINSQRKLHVQPSPFQRPKSFKRWTKEEESKLISNFLDGTTLDKIAEQHERVILPFCKGRGSRNVTQPWPAAAWV